MKIRKSTEQDLGRIMDIYRYARQFMADHGNPNQWGPTCWPPETLIRKDIADGNSYVCTNAERILNRPIGRSQKAAGWMTARMALFTGSLPTVPKEASACSASTGHTISADISVSTPIMTISLCRTLSENSASSIAAQSMYWKTMPQGWLMKNRQPPGRDNHRVLVCLSIFQHCTDSA